jgi:hypothetical protein
MARRRITTGAFTIGGIDRREFPTIGLALSYAQNLAVRAEEPRQWGVYEDGTRVARVEREEDGSVTTQAVAR